MASVIGGAGTGLLDSSLYLLNRNDRTREGETGHGEQLYVNIANGALVVAHQDAFMPSRGEDFALIRTYNSRGNWNTNVGQGFTLSAFLELSQITNNKISLINPDTSEFLFNWDAARQAYVSVDGPGAYEHIVQDKKAKTYILTRSDQSRYTFDINGDLLRSEDTNGNVMTYSRQGGKLKSIQDDTGHLITLVYKGSDLTEIRDEAEGTLVRYEYGNGGRLVSVTDREGHITRYSYFTNGYLESVTHPSNSATGEAARTIRFTYDPNPIDSNGQTRLLRTITDAEGGVTYFEYQFRRDNFNKYDGGTTSMVDALGYNRTRSNDAVYAQWRLANGYYATYDAARYASDAGYRSQADEIWANHSTVFTYDKNGEILSVTQRKTANGAVGYEVRSEYAYDAKEDLVAVVDPNGVAITRSDDVYFRDLRREFGVVDPLTGQGKLAAELTDSEKAALKERFTTHLEYDDRGNLTKRTDADDNVTSYTYTGFNKLASQTAPMGQALTTRDDPFYVDKREALGYVDPATGAGKLAAALTPGERAALLALYTTTYAYDARQNVTEIRSPGGDLTRFEYDGFGNLSRRIVYLDQADLADPAKQQITQYFYDAFGNNVRTVDAEGYATLAAYDHFGNRLAYTDGNGGVTTYTYDKDNRLITVTDPEGNVTVNTYDSVGNRVAVRDAAGHTVTYVYDRNNMLLAVLDPAATPGDTRQTGYTYDVVGNRLAQVDAEGRETRYVFREDRRLLETIAPQTAGPDGTTPTTYRTTYEYDAVGNRTSVRDHNGNLTRYVFSANNLVKESTDALGDVRRYSFDANLNQVQVVIGAALSPAQRRVLRFAYDEEDQLTAEVDALGETTRYQYDAPGNRIAVTDANGNTTDFEYDRNNRLIREIRPQTLDGRTGTMVRHVLQHAYDGNGNEIRTVDENGHATSVAFDRNDRTVLITDANGNQTVFRYDSRANRTQVLIGVAAHLDAGGRVVVDSTADGQVTSYLYNEFNEVVARVDGLGNTERYRYDRVGNRVSTTDNEGRLTQFAYDSLNRLARRTDALGGVMRYRYDGNGNRVGITDQNGRITAFAFDALDRLTSSLDANGVLTARTYDNVGNLLAETRAANMPGQARATSYIYDLNNRLRAQTSPEGNSVGFEYDAVGNRLRAIDARGNPTRYVYDARNRLVKTIDPLGFETRTEYDGVGNRISRIDARGGVQRMTYDPGNRMVEMVDAEGRITRYIYDTRNNRIAQTTAFGTPQAETTRFQYDAQNNLVSITDAEGNLTRHEFDRVYNRTRVVDGNGHATDYAYDALDRTIQVTDAVGAVTRYSYDAVGNRLVTTDALGRQTSFGYDPVDRVIRETAADGVETRYVYDAVGNRITVVRAANTADAAAMEFRYDLDDRLVQERDPVGASTLHEYDGNGNRIATTDRNGHRTVYEYDANNRVVRIVDPEGNAVRYAYDGNGNRVQVVDARGFASTTYYNGDNQADLTVDNEGYALAFEYDANGNVTRQTLYATRLALPLDPSVRPAPVADPGRDQVVNFSYDRLNRQTARVDGEGNRTEYAYDAVGNRTEMRMVVDAAVGRVATTRYYYDDVNRLVGTLSPEGYLTQSSYDALGNKTAVTRYDTPNPPPAPGALPAPAPGDGRHEALYAYDAVNRVVQETNSLGIATLHSYDARGNRVRTVDAAGRAEERITRYAYDRADRMVEVIDGLGYVTRMTLDANGNVLLRHEAAGSAQQRLFSFAYDANNRVVQEVDPLGVRTLTVYDASGNVLSKRVTDGSDERLEAYAYDGNSRLVGTQNGLGEATEFAYDAAGNRVRLTQAPGLAEARSNLFEYDRANRQTASIDGVGTRTEYRYDGAGNKIEAIQAAGVPEERHTHYRHDLDKRVVEVVDPMGGTTRYQYDVLGNQTVVVDPNGGIQRNEFDALGRFVRSVSPGGVLTLNAYDARNNLLAATQSWEDGSDARTTTYRYDLLDRQIEVTDGEGFSTSIEVDAFGNQTRVVHGRYLPAPGDPGYDPGKAARAFPVENRFEYDRADRLLALTDGLGTVTAYAYDAFGNRISTTEAASTPVSKSTTYRYDGANRLIETRTPEGGIARNAYNAVGDRVLEQLLQSGTEASGIWIVRAYEFDRNGRETVQIDPYGTRNQTIYDSVGNAIEVRTAAGTADQRVKRTEYDLNNRVSAQIDGEGNRTEYDYDAAGNRTKVTDAQGHVARYYFDRANRLVTVLDPVGYVNTFDYDSAGNQVEARVWMTRFAGAPDDALPPSVAPSPLDRITSIGYDRANREIARVVSDGSTTSKTYDGAGNLVEETLYANTAASRQRSYRYDGNNRLVRFDDVDGVVTRFEYDASNNKTAEAIFAAADPNPLRLTRFEYDLNNRKTRDVFDPAGLNIVQGTAYDRLGNVVAKTDGNGSATHYQYDLNNRVVRESNALGEIKHYQYDRAGNLVRGIDARGYATDFVFDGNGRIEQEIRPQVEVYTVADGLRLARPTIQRRYDGAGNEVQTTDANGSITTRWFDANGRRIAELSGDNVLRTYGFNAAGDEVSETLYMTRLSPSAHDPATLPASPAGEARTIEREYDLAGRLTRVVYPEAEITSLAGTDGASPAASRALRRPEERSAYDAFGNRVEQFDRNGARSLAWFDIKGRQVAVADALGYLVEFDYDAQDNVLEQRVYTQPLSLAGLSPDVRPTAPGGEVYVTTRIYDTASRVVEERAAQIEVFDPATSTIAFLRPITRNAYDQVGNLLRRTIAAGTAQEQTEYGYFDAANRRVGVINAGGVLHRYAYDANGNLTARSRYLTPVAAGVDPAALTAAGLDGQIVAAPGGDQHSVLQYDGANRLIAETDLMSVSDAADDLAKRYRYDAADQRTWVQDEDGYVVRTAYDGVGRAVQSIGGDGSGSRFEYDAAGNRILAYTGEVDNQTTPASGIALALSGTQLQVNWTAAGPSSTRSWVAYDAVSRASPDGYANVSALQSNLSGTTHRVGLPAGAPGATVYFRIVTEDFAGNRSWTAEQSATFPPLFDAVEVGRPSSDSVSVTVGFEGAVAAPRLLYGPAGSAANAVDLVSLGGGRYRAVLSGVGDAQALVFRIQWQDGAGNTYLSREQPFEARADQVGIVADVSEGTVSGGGGTGYTINLAARMPEASAQTYRLLEAQWRQIGSAQGYAATGAEGVSNPAGYRSYALSLGAGAPLAAGRYEVVLRGITDTAAVTLETFEYEVGAGAGTLNLQGASWAAPPAGSTQLAILDGEIVPSNRAGEPVSRVLMDTPLAPSSSAPYTVYYTTPQSADHTLGVTSTPVFEDQPDPDDPGGPPISVLVGYDLQVTTTFSAGEASNVAGNVFVGRRPAGSGAAFDDTIALSAIGGGAWRGTFARLPAGQYELKVTYVDSQGREVIADWGVGADTAVASATTSGRSQIVEAYETGGTAARNANGLISLDPGLYVGALRADALKDAVALPSVATGSPAGSADANRESQGYFSETVFNALNVAVASNENDGLWRTYGVDANGNTLETRLYGDRTASDYIASYAAFDARNRVVAQWGAPAQTASGTQRPVTRRAYNVLDKVTQETDPLGRVRRFEYNALGSLTREFDALGNAQSTRIDVFGNTTAILSKLGNTELKFYDTLGRLERERDAAGRETGYAYDAFGRRIAMTDGRGMETAAAGDFTTRYEYDQRDRLTVATTPLGNSTLFGYDGRNNRTQVTDANGHTTTQSFDALGRVSSTRTELSFPPGILVKPGATPPVVENTRSYDAFGNVVAERDGAGRVKSSVFGGFARLLEEIDEDGNRTINEYDRFGRLVGQTGTGEQAQKHVVQTYDDAGRLLSVTDYATGTSTVYTYDLVGGRLTERVTTPGNSHDRSYGYQYDALGQLISWSDAVTGLQLRTQYDAEGNIRRTFTDLGYDPQGENRDPGTGDVINPNYRFVDQYYTYDASRKLTQLVRRTVDQAGNASDTLISAYTYDSAGNRTSWNNQGILVGYTYDADGRLMQGAWTEGGAGRQQSWTYDAVGNVATYVFNDGSSTKTTTNEYDALNRNTRSVVDGQETTRTYDLSSRLTRLTLKDQGKTYNYDYTYFGDGRERSIRSYGDASGNSSSTYDVNKVRVAINQGQGDQQSRPETKNMVVDNEGRILFYDHDDGKSAAREQRAYAYALGYPVGETGQGTDGKKQTLIDSGRYSLVLEYGENTPSSAVTSWTVRPGESLQSIAAAVYGNPSLWFVLAEANGLTGGEQLKAGTVLKVPNNIDQGLLTSGTHKVYNEGEVVDSTLPNLKSPPPPKKDKGCGGFVAILIIVVIAVVVAVVTAGVGGALVAAGGGTFLGLSGAAATIAAFAVAGVVVGAVGAIVQQGLFIALGYQDEFDWRAVAAGAVAGGLAGAAAGVGAAAQAGKLVADSVNYTRVTAAALEVSAQASRQLITNGKITSWTSLASSALGGFASASQGISQGASKVSGEAASRLGTKAADVLAAQAAGAASLGATVAKVSQYATPWVQLAETYARNKGVLTPADWASAVGATLSSAVADSPLAAADASQFAGQLRNAALKAGTNLLVGGALAITDREAGRGYIENAIGNEVGQLIGDSIGRSLKGYFDQLTEDITPRVARAKAIADPLTGTAQRQAESVAGGLDAQTRVAEDPFGNPQKALLLVADSGEITTDVTPGLLAGAADVNENQTPALSTRMVGRGDSFWKIAAEQLGPDATPEQIQRQVYALMELNPGVNPRSLQAGQELVLVAPDAGVTASAATIAAYQASDAEYQAYREERIRLAQVQRELETTRITLDPYTAERAADTFGLLSVADTELNPYAAGGLGLMAPNAALLPEERILFGQKRASPEFGPSVDRQGRPTGRPEYLADRTISEVAQALKEGKLSPDQLQIEVFEYQGRKVSANTRSLAALAEAGMQPTNIKIIEATPDLLARLGEAPLIPDAPLPGPKLPITKTQGSGEILNVVELPETAKMKFVKGANVAGKGLALVGVAVDSYSLGTEISQSLETGQWSNTGREATRIAGGWTGAWAGAETGAAIGLACGPAAWICSPVGGLVGGFAGYWAGSNAATTVYDQVQSPRTGVSSPPR
jgi:YD repeat-containing protein